jgi:NAD(P)H-dependent FMN reductase
MKPKKLFIPIILGTTRKGRRSEYVAKYLYKRASMHSDIEAKLFDVRDFVFPRDGYGQDIKDVFPEYRDAVINADGFILVAPEYNHSFSGDLKKVIDLMLQDYIHKAVGLCGVSAGGFGGTRVIESLVPVVRELGLVVTFTDLNVSKAKDFIDEKCTLIDPKMGERIDGFLAELIWMAKVLRWGRENVKSKYHV